MASCVIAIKKQKYPDLILLILNLSFQYVYAMHHIYLYFLEIKVNLLIVHILFLQFLVVYYHF